MSGNVTLLSCFAVFVGFLVEFIGSNLSCYIVVNFVYGVCITDEK